MRSSSSITSLPEASRLRLRTRSQASIPPRTISTAELKVPSHFPPGSPRRRTLIAPCFTAKALLPDSLLAHPHLPCPPAPLPATTLPGVSYSSQTFLAPRRIGVGRIPTA